MSSATLQLRIGQHSFAISLPNQGQYLAIESLKMALTDDRYEKLATSNLLNQLKAADMADATAYFTVLCPQLLAELSYKTFSELPLDLSQQVVEAYKTQFLPWFTPHHRRILGLQPLPPVSNPDDAAAPAAD